MSKFSISEISLKQLIVGGIGVVLGVGVVFWFTNGHRATYPSSPELRSKEARRVHEAFREALKKRPPVWQNNPN